MGRKGGDDDDEEEGLFGDGSFEDLGLCPVLSQHMRDRMGFVAPTHIQQSSIPLILSGKDVLVKAETGSGKTISYLAPIVHGLQANLKKVARDDGTLALVLVPTRELCLQVYGVMQQMVHRFHWLVPGYLMGGENRSKEKARLRKGITMLVATPGRLLDHLQHTSCFRHDNLRWLILDEADRLLDLGFGKDIESILSCLGSGEAPLSNGKGKGSKKARQHVLLSATLSDQVSRLASLSLTNPAVAGLNKLSVSSKSSTENATVSLSEKFSSDSQCTEYILPAHLSQSYVKVPGNLRLVTLLALLRMLHTASKTVKIVVFMSTCDAVDFHYALIGEFSWNYGDGSGCDGGFLKSKSFRLHGNMTQQERTETYQKFNGEDEAVLLCTDVVARGLDFPKVSHIIQYDPPGDAVEYVHRVGRTARLGKKGECYLFLLPCESEYLQELQRHGVALKEFELGKILDTMIAHWKEKRPREDDIVASHPGATVLQGALEAFISGQASVRSLAADAFRSYVRAYAANKGELKKFFRVKRLHLGHVAKSFGLLQRPALIGKSLNKEAKRRAKKQLHKRPAKRRKLRTAAMGE